MKITPFFSDVLHAKLKNQVWSWGAHDETSNRVFLRVWDDQVEKRRGVERVRVDGKSAPGSPGRNERRAHLEAIRRGAEAYGVLCRAQDTNPVGSRRIKDFDENALVRFSRIFEEGDTVFAEINDRIPVRDLRRAAPRNQWHLEPGARIKRKDLHKRYGGRSQGGIGPSAKSPNVFLFSDPASGEQHGYFDGWQPDGCFHYTGEGQRGDQQLAQGNLAVLNARRDGRALRLFNGTGGLIEYVDEVIVDSEEPYYTTDAVETGGGPIRSVIVFRLRPVSVRPKIPEKESLRTTTLVVDRVPVESQHTERTFVDPSGEEHEAERRESGMVQRYKAYLEAQGHVVERLRIKPPSEAKPLFCDLYVEQLGLLIEAKGSTNRQSIRMAIGQLTDYRRFVSDDTTCAILVPSRPRVDLIQLIKSAGIDLIYEDNDTFIG